MLFIRNSHMKTKSAYKKTTLIIYMYVLCVFVHFERHAAARAIRSHQLCRARVARKKEFIKINI